MTIPCSTPGRSNHGGGSPPSTTVPSSFVRTEPTSIVSCLHCVQLHELKKVERLPISDRCNGTRYDRLLSGQKVFSLTLPTIFLATRLMNFLGKRIRQIAELQQSGTVYFPYTVHMMYGDLQVLYYVTSQLHHLNLSRKMAGKQPNLPW